MIEKERVIVYRAPGYEDLLEGELVLHRLNIDGRYRSIVQLSDDHLVVVDSSRVFTVNGFAYASEWSVKLSEFGVTPAEVRIPSAFRVGG